MVRPSHAVSVAGIVAVIALGAGGLAISRTANGSGVPGIPHVVASRLGAAPLVLTLHQSVLALLSPPGVDRLAALEAAIARRPDVRGEYGPVSWLRSQLSLIASTIAARTSSRVTRADLLVRYGATGGLSIDNQGLASTLVFGSGIQPLRGCDGCSRATARRGSSCAPRVRDRGPRSPVSLRGWSSAI